MFGVLGIKYLQHLFYAGMPIRVCIKQDFFIVFYKLTVDYVIQAEHKSIMKRTKTSLSLLKVFYGLCQENKPSIPYFLTVITFA